MTAVTSTSTLSQFLSAIELPRPLGLFFLDHVATSILQSAPDTEIRNRLVAEILTRFKPYADNLLLREYLPVYRERLMVIGKKVTLHRGRDIEEVLVRDLTDDRTLVVETKDGLQKEIASGEVSLRMRIGGE